MMLDELNELNKLLPSVWEPRAPPFQRWPRPWQLRETPQEGLRENPNSLVNQRTATITSPRSGACL
jgi:hypothetical protein